MSMSCMLIMASDDCLEELKKSPDRLGAFLMGPARAKPGFFARLLGKPEPPPAPGHACKRFEGDEYIPDTAWHGLQFLLTGTAWDDVGPSSFFVAGGTPVNAEATAVAFKSEEVKAIAGSLAEVTAEQLRSRYDAEAMVAAEIYPTLVWEQADSLDWLLDGFNKTREFVRAAGAQGMGMVRYIG